MDGIFNLIKPPGMSSSDAVVDIRRLTGVKRVGHLGTLDPGAAGVLPVCVGRAARLFDYLVDKEKEYLAEIAFGQSTDTQDAFGKVLESADCHVTAEQLAAVLPRFRGAIEQVAPMYSALKHEGKKLYDLALSGAPAVEKKRVIEIGKLELIEQTGTNRFLLRVGCSRGTYIRTLCRDIGLALGLPAHMSFLLRTRSGPFTLDDAYTIPELTALAGQGKLETALISCEQALNSLPAITLPADRATPTRNGLDTRVPNTPNGPVRVYAPAFLGIGEVNQGRLTLKVHLYS
ncbi:MAG: tRNA pseudouridine(55) synthase TruB [Clostridiales bacterium]|nr:tRNA pseudouridine(55) synthase TruB [Clostridiales bacterium]